MIEYREPFTFNFLFIPRNIYRELEKLNKTSVLANVNDLSELEKLLSTNTIGYLAVLNIMLLRHITIGTPDKTSFFDTILGQSYLYKLSKSELSNICEKVKRDLDLTDDPQEHYILSSDESSENQADKYFDTVHQSEYSLVAVFNPVKFKEIFRSKDKFQDFVLSLLELIYDKENDYRYQVEDILNTYFSTFSPTFTDTYLQIKTLSFLNQRS